MGNFLGTSYDDIIKKNARLPKADGQKNDTILFRLFCKQVNSQLHVVRNSAYSIFHAKQSSVEAKESLGKKSFVV
jgi:hypothetical protein